VEAALSDDLCDGVRGDGGSPDGVGAEAAIADAQANDYRRLDIAPVAEFVWVILIVDTPAGPQ
jgi:hypothetical protein